MGDDRTDQDVPITRRFAPRGRHAGAEDLKLSGLERARLASRGHGIGSPVTTLTGLRISDAGFGMLTVTMPATPWWQSGAGVFPAGALAFVADSPATGCVMTTAPAWVGVSTSQLSMDFLRPATIRSQTIIGRGRLVHATRSLGLGEVFIEDGRGRLLAHGTARGVLTEVDPTRVPERRIVGNPDSTEPKPYELPFEGEVRDQTYYDTTPGIDIIRESMDKPHRSPFARFFGVSTLSVEEGRSTVGLDASAWLTSGIGTIYGGAIALLADAAINGSIFSVLPAATAFSPLDIKINFLRPALPENGQMTATAKLVHRGRSIAVSHCEVFNPAGKLLAVATESILILPGRQWGDRPVHVADEMPSDGEEANP